MEVERFTFGSQQSRTAPEPGLELRSLFEAVLDALPHAILVVGPASVPIFKNAAARELLNRGDGLLVKRGKLTASAPRDARRLAACIEETASAAPEGRARSGKWLKIDRSRGMPYAMFLGPLCCQAELTPGGRGAALVVALELDREIGISPKGLEELFGLTRAEARLSCALLAGHRIDTAAEQLGITLNTARTQIRAVFAKLHLTRQQDLVRLLSMLTTISPEMHSTKGS